MLLLPTASFCYLYLLIIYIVSCETLQSTTDMIVTLTSTAMGSNATYQCRDGSSDVYTTQCTSDGVWEPSPNSTLNCTTTGTMLASYPGFFPHVYGCLYFIISVLCEILQSTENIIVNFTTTTMGINATYQCRDGSSGGSDLYTTQCTSDGVWEPNPNSTLDCITTGTMLASYPVFSTCIWMPLYTTSLSFQCCVKFFNLLKIS